VVAHKAIVQKMSDNDDKKLPSTSATKEKDKATLAAKLIKIRIKGTSKANQPNNQMPEIFKRESTIINAEIKKNMNSDGHKNPKRYFSSPVESAKNSQDDKDKRKTRRMLDAVFSKTKRSTSVAPPEENNAEWVPAFVSECYHELSTSSCKSCQVIFMSSHGR
jgi:hypothetical protein